MHREWNGVTFSNKSDNNYFLQNGYYISNFIDDSEVRIIKEQLLNFDTAGSPFFHSRIIKDLDKRKQIKNIIIKFISPRLKRINTVNEYKIAEAVLVVKNKGKKSAFSTHTDDSLCDERYFMPYHLWIPLVDINSHNGGICLLKGSHQRTNILRGRTIPDKYLNSIIKSVDLNYDQPEIKAGDCIVYHPGCIHFSPPNTSVESRYALVISCIPAIATKSVFLRINRFLFRSQLMMYEIENSAFDYDAWDNYSVPKNVKSHKINFTS